MKRLEAIRKAKDWRARLKLAEDKYPGTEFDPVFEMARQALDPVLCAHFARENFERLGEGLAAVIEAGDSATLHRLADALNVWRRHTRQQRDPMREAIIGLCGNWPTTSVRDIITNIKLRGGAVSEHTPGDIRREAKKLGLANRIKGRAGRPPKEPVQKGRAKV